MTFLTPWSALLAAAVAIPLLALLYFLKLRRRYLRVPSTLLWQSAFEDLQVNVPFQRLRWSLLLLLQLLALLAVLLAIAQPVAQADAPGRDRVILLIDVSASMSTIVEGAGDAEAGGRRTRLDEARVIAAEIVDRLLRASGQRQVMVVSVASSPTIVCGFEARRDALLEAVSSIEPTDGSADLEAALRLAEAFAMRADESQGTLPEIVLLSDGGVLPPEGGGAALGGYALRAGEFRYVQVVPPETPPAANLGIVTFSARRRFDDPRTVLVFARLANAGPEPVETVLTLRRDGEVAAIERLEVPATGSRGDALSEASITIPLELPGGGVLSLTQGRGDALAADDTAVLLLPAPRPPHVALVHGGDAPDPFLREVLEACEPASLDVISAGRFAGLDAAALDAGGRYDVIVFDRMSGHRLPGVPSLTIGGAPAGIEVQPPPREGGWRFLSWRRQHPLLHHVALDEIVFSGFGALRLPSTAETLARGEQGAVIGVVRSRGASHVLVGFALDRSTWPVDVSFTVFIANFLEWATAATSGQAGITHRPGEPITVRAGPGATELAMTGPFGARAEVPVTGGGAVTLPAPRRAGLYEVDGAQPPDDVIAVSVLSDVETDVRPRDRLLVNAAAVEAAGPGAAAPLELWPWLLGAAIMLLCVEWVVYCARSSGR